uniref:Ig-like domain-containing protein n=1 Tax=Apteryx owenii TaxID=8824 RepID=A0A8B9PAD3_APTOW
FGFFLRAGYRILYIYIFNEFILLQNSREGGGKGLFLVQGAAVLEHRACAGSIDAWGRGTAVTVSSAPLSRTPDVYAITPCCDAGTQGGEAVLACLVQGSSVESIAVEWFPPELAGAAVLFPPLRQPDGFTSSSRLALPPGAGRRQDLRCSVRNSAGKDAVTKAFPPDACVAVQRARWVHLVEPPCLDAEGPAALELVCILWGFEAGRARATWLLNGVEKGLKTQVSIIKGENGSASSHSRLEITRESWDSGDIYTCKVTYSDGDKGAEMYNTSKCQACASSSVRPQVYVTQPPFDDVLSGSAVATCLLLGWRLHGAKLFWQADGSRRPERPVTNVTPHANGTESLLATYPVLPEEWKTGLVLTCHAEVPCHGNFSEELAVGPAPGPRKVPAVSVSRAVREGAGATGPLPPASLLLCEASG